MYKHILIPTDGSRLAAKGVKAGVRLARALGAKVTGVYVIPPYQPPVYGEGTVYFAGRSLREYMQTWERQAKKALAMMEIEAQTARVRYAGRFLVAQPPWQGILATARARKCDAIVIASHGRGGLGGLILGSETTHVLANSKLPVLVVR